MSEISPDTAIEFLEEAARYFEHRDTHGEDKAYWANVYNAESCRRVAQLIRKLRAPGEAE